MIPRSTHSFSANPLPYGFGLWVALSPAHHRWDMHPSTHSNTTPLHIVARLTGGGVYRKPGLHARFCEELLSGGDIRGTRRERANSVGRPFCRPHPGCGYWLCGSGYTPSVPHYPPAGTRTQDLPTGEMLGRSPIPRTNQGEPCLASEGSSKTLPLRHVPPINYKPTVGLYSTQCWVGSNPCWVESIQQAPTQQLSY